MRNYQFVFIGGLHRSGTSLLFQCLREHPLISGFRNTGAFEDEGQHLQTVYPPAKAYGGPGEFGFNPEAHLNETSNLTTDDNRERLFSDWKRHWNLKKPVLLEKSPPNLIQMRFLQALFPDSHFIVLMRHPIATSYATQKWSKTSVASLIGHWLACYERFEQDRRHIKRLLTLKYENFVAKPQLTLEKIYSFIGVNLHPNQLKVCSDINEKYFEKWREDQRNFMHKSFFESFYIRWRCEKRVSKFGYSLYDLNKRVNK